MHPARHAADAAQREHDLAGRAPEWRVDRFDFASDHHTDECRLVELINAICAHAFTVAENSHAIGEREYFLQPVRDVDHAHTAGAELADFLLRERRRRLVHDDDARAGAEGAGNLHELLLGHGKRAHFRAGIDLGANAVQQFRGAGPAFAPADEMRG